MKIATWNVTTEINYRIDILTDKIRRSERDSLEIQEIHILV